VSFVKLSEVTGDKTYAARALEIALAMKQRGTLAPHDEWMIEALEKLAAP